MTYKQADPDVCERKKNVETPADGIDLQGQRTEVKSIEIDISI